jgi:hypothetical protein
MNLKVVISEIQYRIEKEGGASMKQLKKKSKLSKRNR